jgi:hypothetical protein
MIHVNLRSLNQRIHGDPDIAHLRKSEILRAASNEGIGPLGINLLLQVIYGFRRRDVKREKAAGV